MSGNVVTIPGAAPLSARPESELRERQRLLESEIEANEEENREMQRELDSIYAELDRRSGQ